jgi:hypothetical protein
MFDIFSISIWIIYMLLIQSGWLGFSINGFIEVSILSQDINIPLPQILVYCHLSITYFVVFIIGI